MTHDWHIEYETEHCKAPGHAIIEAQSKEMAEALFLAQRPAAFILRSTPFDDGLGTALDAWRSEANK